MSTFIGKDGAVYVGTNAVAEVRDFSLESSSEIVNDTVMGDDFMTNKATQKSWSATVNCYYDSSDTTGQLALDEGATVTLNLYPEGNTSGKTYYTGSVIVTSISRSQSFDGLVEVTFNGTGTGALTESSV